MAMPSPVLRCGGELLDKLQLASLTGRHENGMVDEQIFTLWACFRPWQLAGLERRVENAIAAKKRGFGDQVDLCSVQGTEATERSACQGVVDW